MGILDGLGNLAPQTGSVPGGAGHLPWEAFPPGSEPGGGPDPASRAADATVGFHGHAGAQTLDLPGWMPSPDRGGAGMEAAAELVSTLARNPDLRVDAAGDPLQAGWQAGREIAGSDTPRAETAGDSEAAGLAEVIAQAQTDRSIGGRPVLAFESMDDFNLAANAARPDTVYEFDTYRWTTDDQARVIRAEGRVDLEPVGRNDSGLQAEIGNEGRDTDVGFHIIADRLGGPTNRLNVVPGNGMPIGDGLPNLNNGEYKRFENELARLAEAGHAVDMRVSAQYNRDNTSNRPDTFVAEYRVDGGDWIDQTFPNK